MMRTKKVAAARASEVFSKVVRWAKKSKRRSCKDVGGPAAGENSCSLAWVRAAFRCATVNSEDRLPCDRLDLNWSRRLEDATVAAAAGSQGERKSGAFTAGAVLILRSGVSLAMLYCAVGGRILSGTVTLRQGLCGRGQRGRGWCETDRQLGALDESPTEDPTHEIV